MAFRHGDLHWRPWRRFSKLEPKGGAEEGRDSIEPSIPRLLTQGLFVSREVEELQAFQTVRSGGWNYQGRLERVRRGQGTEPGKDVRVSTSTLVQTIPTKCQPSSASKRQLGRGMQGPLLPSRAQRRVVFVFRGCFPTHSNNNHHRGWMMMEQGGRGWWCSVRS